MRFSNGKSEAIAINPSYISKSGVHTPGISFYSWYRTSVVNLKGQLRNLSQYIVADAYFSVRNFVYGLSDEGLHLISRLRDNANLRYMYMYKSHIARRIISLCGCRPYKSLNVQFLKELYFIAAPVA